jgi:hypothetical protein
VTVLLRHVAFVRSGDKGDTLNMGVVPFDEDDFEALKDVLTVDLVRETFGPIVTGDIVRYEFTGIRSLNFVMDGALDGGVSRSITLDEHGKQKQSLMADIVLPGWDRPIPDHLWGT